MQKKSIFKVLIAEPLLHFLVIGVAIFALYQWQRPATQLADNEIVVTAAETAQLLSGFERTWQRPPTDRELNGVIENFVRDEIYYREGRALGLDQDDIVVRRRLRQKLEFILEDVAVQVEPTDEQLAAFMVESAEKYMFEPRFSFRQVYLNPEVRRAQLDSEIKRLLAQLNAEKAAGFNPASLSDSSLLPGHVNRWTGSAVAGNFGKKFLAGLEGGDHGSWFGPVESQLGSHLVLLQEHQQGRLPELSEIKESVRNDWLRQRRDDYADKAYREVRERYQVTIEAAENSPAELALIEQSK